MGQAKGRGSKQDRAEQAKQRCAETAKRLGIEKRPLAEIKAELGLPEDCIFHGYAIHIPGSDVFLTEFQELKDSYSRQWAKRPELAKCYSGFVDAYEISRAERGEIVVAVFETDTQFFVSSVL